MEDDIRQRIASLEQQLRELRHQLGNETRDESDSKVDDVEPLPTEIFDALEVRIGKEWYAVPIHAIREVVQMLWPRPLPESPDWVLGTFLYGEESVPLIDLRSRLSSAASGLAPAMIDPAASVLVGSALPASAFVVDEIRDLLRVDPATVTPPRTGIPQGPFLLGAMRNADDKLIRLLSLLQLSRELGDKDETGDSGTSDGET